MILILLGCNLKTILSIFKQYKFFTYKMSSIPTKSANTTHSDTKKIFNSELSTIRSFNDDDLPYFNLEP